MSKYQKLKLQLLKAEVENPHALYQKT